MKNIYEEKIEAQIKNAIARSESHDQIVHIKIDGDSGDAFTAIRQLTDCDTDFSMFDREGVDTLDVWGLREDHIGVWGFGKDAKDGDMIWRLNITFTGNI